VNTGARPQVRPTLATRREEAAEQVRELGTDPVVLDGKNVCAPLIPGRGRLGGAIPGGLGRVAARDQASSRAVTVTLCDRRRDLRRPADAASNEFLLAAFKPVEIGLQM
jgi:hypothetical protein